MKGFHIDEGWIMIVLLSCLALAVTFLSFGLGLVNLADAGSAVAAVAQPPKVNPPEPVQRDDQEQLERAARNLREETEAHRREVELYQSRLHGYQQEREQVEAAAAEARQRLAAARQQAQRMANELEDQRKRAAGRQAEAEQQARQHDALEGRLRKQHQELAQAERRVRDLTGEIEKAKANNPLGRYYGLTSARNPQFVECHATGVVLQPQGRRITLEELKSHKQAFIAALGRDHDAIIFLVRPDGIPAFEAAREIAEERKLKLGYEPVEAQTGSAPAEGGRRLA